MLKDLKTGVLNNWILVAIEWCLINTGLVKTPPVLCAFACWSCAMWEILNAILCSTYLFIQEYLFQIWKFTPPPSQQKWHVVSAPLDTATGHFPAALTDSLSHWFVCPAHASDACISYRPAKMAEKWPCFGGPQPSLAAWVRYELGGSAPH